MDHEASSLALAQRLQAEEDLRWRQAQSLNHANASGEALLLQNREVPQQRQLLVASANQVVYDVRSSGRFILLAVTYGVIELVSGCVVLGSTFQSTCDVPLKMWLVIFLLRYCIVFPQELARYIAHSRRHDELMFNVQNLDKVRGSFSFIWTILGLLWTLGNPAAECRNTSPVLWYFCTTLILMHIALACSPLILLAMFCMCLPCLLLLLRFFQPHEGMSNADVRKLPERVFDSDNRGSQAEACVICQNDFANGDRLRHLPYVTGQFDALPTEMCNRCRHEFHSACLGQWLILKATCPLCRVHVDGRGEESHGDLQSPV